jgi:hypothetical protein
LAGAGVGLGLWPSRVDVQPQRPLRVLDQRELAILVAVASRMVTAKGANPLEIAHKIDSAFAVAVPEVQRDFKRLLQLLENALVGALLEGRPRPFTRLDPPGQDGVLDAWRRSRLALRRSGYQALRKLTAAVHYMDPAAWAAIGYPGPPQLPS